MSSEHVLPFSNAAAVLIYNQKGAATMKWHVLVDIGSVPKRKTHTHTNIKVLFFANDKANVNSKWPSWKAIQVIKLNVNINFSDKFILEIF